MLVFDYFRGTDSTGLGVVKKSGEVAVAKMASHPLDLFDTKRFSQLCTGSMASVFLGHNRAATKGAVNTVNAHPYEYGHIMGAHNGTLEKSSWEDLKKLCGEDTDTDSQAIFASIAKVGIEETVKVLQGAWALVWVNSQDNTLNFLKNKERPLWYAYEEKFEKMFWASEWWMIQSALKSSTPTNLWKSPDNFHFWSFEDDTHYRYDLADMKAWSNDKTIKPTVKPMKGKEPTPVTTYYTNGTTPFVDRTRTNSSSSHGNAGAGCKTQRIDSYPVLGSKDKPWAWLLSEQEFYEKTQGKCTFCGDVVTYDMKNVTVYLDESLCLCADCTGCDGNVSRVIVNEKLMEIVLAHKGAVPQGNNVLALPNLSKAN